jgi:hypothetical protein
VELLKTNYEYGVWLRLSCELLDGTIHVIIAPSTLPN